MPVEGPAESIGERVTQPLTGLPAPQRPVLQRPVLQRPPGEVEPVTASLALGPEQPATTAPVELRVHGVTGTPAEQMLDRQIIGRVAGSPEAGFFRPRAEYGATLGPGGARMEAYRWGNLTAGAAARAFWLLLLPFSLANVAIWMFPPVGRVGRRIVRPLIRIFALTVTATFTLAPIGISLDLVAWQCAATEENRCIDARPWLGFLFAGFFEPTGRRLAVAALLPIGVIATLWFLARRTWARYESYQLPTVRPDGGGVATPTFWDGRAQVGRLRSVHIATALATVDAILLYVLLRHDLATDAYAGVDLGWLSPSTVLIIGTALGWASGCLLALSPVLLFLPAMVDRDSRSRGAHLLANGLRSVSILLTALTLGYAVLPRAPWRTDGGLPGYADTVTALFATQAGLLGLLTLIALALRHRCRGALLGGLGGPVVASLGLGIAAAFSAGLSYRVADVLDGGAVPSPADFGAQPSMLRLEPPVSYQWAAFGSVVVVAVALLSLGWTRLITTPELRRGARAQTDADYPDGRRRDPARATAIDRAVAAARLADCLGRTVAVAWLVLAAAGLAATVLALTGTGPVQLARSGSTAADVLSILTNLGTYLISLSAVGLVLLGIQTYRSERVRRTVGVIWDLATFWPRAAHPLAPPCYAERVVPELVYRGGWLALEQGGLILSGHSQGSVLAAAAVLQLPKPAQQRTALLTYGSPLRRLYQRAFPAFWGKDVLGAVGAAVSDAGGPRWINLWRRTDPIGGEVGTGDRRLIDPVGFNPPPGDRVPPAVAGHSGYQVTPEFAEAVTDLVGRLRPAGSAT